MNVLFHNCPHYADESSPLLCPAYVDQMKTYPTHLDADIGYIFKEMQTTVKYKYMFMREDF